MAEYHVGIDEKGICAGGLNAKRDGWKDKSNVTMECLLAVAQYNQCEMLENGTKKKTLEFAYSDKGILVTFELIDGRGRKK